MSDPLFLLRQATINKTPPTLSDGFCDFGHIRLPENTKTCFRRTLKSKFNEMKLLRSCSHAFALDR